MSDNASCAKMGKKIKSVKKPSLRKAMPLSEKTAQKLSNQLAGFLQIDCESSSCEKSALLTQGSVMADNSALLGGEGSS